MAQPYIQYRTAESGVNVEFFIGIPCLLGMVY
jgi:hypothetical protein